MSNPSIQPLGPDVFVSVLAGGSGTRFWPKSRHHSPKQLCRIGAADRSMIETTLARLDGFVSADHRMIVTHKDQADATRTTVGAACSRIIAEPEAKNTAAALVLAALEIRALAPAGTNPVMVSLHADHVIRDIDAFRQVIRDAVAVARQGRIALLGIVPQYPETGFGYIERGDAFPVTGVKQSFAVASFREKPPLETAKEYVFSGRFFWNAGLFIWRVDVLLDELRRHLPETLEILESAVARTPDRRVTSIPADQLAAAYAQLKKISIDHAVLEKSSLTVVVPADMGWQDVGSWDALQQCFTPDANKNLVYGDAMTIDCSGMTIDTDGPLVACLGVNNLVVVVSKGAVLVCPQDRAQDVKQFVERLHAQGRKDLI